MCVSQELIDSRVYLHEGRQVTIQRLALDPQRPLHPIISAAATTNPPPTSPKSLTTTPESLIDPELSSAPFFTHLSAEVSPAGISHITWSSKNRQGRWVEFSGWMNIDFQIFAQLSSVIAPSGQTHSFLITSARSAGAIIPSPRPFHSSHPEFIPDGKIPARELTLIHSLLALYASDSSHLLASHRQHLRNQATHKATPTKPTDITIRYRITEASPSQGGKQ